MNETLKTLMERRSVRAYQDKQITAEELDAILQCGTYAPTGMGRQSPRLVVVQDKETLDLLSRLNAQVLGNPAANPFYGAPTAVIVFADATVPTWVQDGSLVMGNLMNAAASLGVGSCWINRALEVFELDEGKALKEKWGIAENFRGVAHCILGYADGPLPDPKPRKSDYIVKV